MKKIKFILTILFLLLATNCWGLTIIAKVGNASHKIGTDEFDRSWRDGQILEIQSDNKYIGTATRKNFAIFHLNADFKVMLKAEETAYRLTHNQEKFVYKSEADKNAGIRKYWENPVWEVIGIKDNGEFIHKHNRKRNYYINYEELLKDKIITKKQYNDILDKGKNRHYRTQYDLYGISTLSTSRRGFKICSTF